MIFLRHLASALVFRKSSIAVLAADRRSGRGVLVLAAGVVCFLIIRKSVYRELLGAGPATANEFVILDWRTAAALLRLLLFLSVFYIPAIAGLAGWISGRARGISIPADSYRALASALFPLWGAAFFIAAPVQLLVPHFVVAEPAAVSAGMLVLLILWVGYGIAGVGEAAGLSVMRATAVILLASLALPAAYLLSGFVLGFPWPAFFP